MQALFPWNLAFHLFQQTLQLGKARQLPLIWKMGSVPVPRNLWFFFRSNKTVLENAEHFSNTGVLQSLKSFWNEVSEFNMNQSSLPTKYVSQAFSLQLVETGCPWDTKFSNYPLSISEALLESRKCHWQHSIWGTSKDWAGIQHYWFL